MINEYICKECGCKFTKLDYPNDSDAFIAMVEHIKTNHGLKRDKILGKIAIIIGFVLGMIINIIIFNVLQ